MLILCEYEERCELYGKRCSSCKRNRNATLKDFFKDRGYAPTCPHGYDDCILDPAYLIYMKYNKIEDFDYDISEGCNDCDNGEWYDDEDK